MTRLRQPVLPASSRARTITRLSPGFRGRSKFQLVVPVAVPELEPHSHVTSFTPVLSFAVPEIRRCETEVESTVTAGLTTVRDGATVSFAADGGCGVGPGAGDGEIVAVRVTDSVRLV